MRLTGLLGITQGGETIAAIPATSAPARLRFAAVIRTRGAALAACLAALGLALDSIALALHHYVAAPIWDGWQEISRFVALTQGAYADAFAQANEHWILVPMIVLVAEVLFDRSRGYLEVAVSLLCQAGTAACLIRSLEPRVRRGAAGLLAGSLILGLLFGLQLYEIFVWGFEVCFPLCFVFGVLALAALAGDICAPPGHAPEVGRRACAALFSLLATFSLGSGLFIAPAAAVTAALTGRLSSLRFAAVLAVAVSGAFFAAYVSPPLADYPQPAPTLSYAAGLVTAILTLVGSCLPARPGPVMLLGLWGLVLSGLAALVTVRAAGPRSRAAVLGLALMLFALASLAAVALARKVPPDGAVPSRYMLPAALFWCGQILFWTSHGAQLRRPAAALAAALTVLVLVLGLAGWREIGRRTLRTFAFEREAQADMLMAALVGPTMEAYVTIAPGEVDAVLAFARSRRLGVFARPEAADLGLPLDARRVVGPCPGRIATAAHLSGLGPMGAELTGEWARRRGFLDARGRILLAVGGRIVGFGSADDGGIWRAFGRASTGARVEVFGVLARESLCRFGDAAIADEPLPEGPRAPI